MTIHAPRKINAPEGAEVSEAMSAASKAFTTDDGKTAVKQDSSSASQMIATSTKSDDGSFSSSSTFSSSNMSSSSTTTSSSGGPGGMMSIGGGGDMDEMMKKMMEGMKMGGGSEMMSFGGDMGSMMSGSKMMSSKSSISSSSSTMMSSSSSSSSKTMGSMMGGMGMPSMLDKMGAGVDFEELSTAGMLHSFLFLKMIDNYIINIIIGGGNGYLKSLVQTEFNSFFWMILKIGVELPIHSAINYYYYNLLTSIFIFHFKLHSCLPKHS